MSEASDIETLLKAHHLVAAKASGWKTAITIISTLLGSAVGAGWVARGYLDTLMTKSQAEALIAGQQSEIKTLGDEAEALSTRIQRCEERGTFHDQRIAEVKSDIREVQARVFRGYPHDR